GHLPGAHGEPRGGAPRPSARDAGADRGRLRERRPGTRHAGTHPRVAGRVRPALHRAARQHRGGERDPRRAPHADGRPRRAGRQRRLRGRTPGADPRLHAGRDAPRAVPVRHAPGRLGARPAPAAPVHRDRDARTPHAPRRPGELNVQWWCAALGEAWEWTWRPYPGVWAFLALLVAAYVLLLRGSPAPPGDTRDRGTRAAVFGAAVAGLWLVLDWPVGALGAGYLASVHMLQFLVMVLVAPPLLLCGLAVGRRAGRGSGR